MGCEKGPQRDFWWLFPRARPFGFLLGGCVCGIPSRTAAIRPEGVRGLWDSSVFAWQLAGPRAVAGGGHPKPSEEALSPDSPFRPRAPRRTRSAAPGRPFVRAEASWEQLHCARPAAPRRGARGDQSAWRLLLLAPRGSSRIQRATRWVLAFSPDLGVFGVWGKEFPEPSIALLLGSRGPGKREDSWNVTAGININKKQMDLRGGQLSINQAARPLTANTAQVGPSETFSWPPPGRTPPSSAHPALAPRPRVQGLPHVVLGQIPDRKGAQSLVRGSAGVLAGASGRFLHL